MVNIKKMVQNIELEENVQYHIEDTTEELKKYLTRLSSYSKEAIEVFLYDYLIKEVVASNRIENTSYNQKILELYSNKLLDGDIDEDKIKLINFLARTNESAMSEEEFEQMIQIKNLDKTYQDYLYEMNENRPGVYRKNNVWIGDTKKVVYQPPAHEEIEDYMKQFVEYFNSDSDVNFVVKSALIHILLIKIHPFRDGNGRLARILMNDYMKKGIEKEMGMSFIYPPINISSSLQMTKIMYFDKQNAIEFSNDADNSVKFNKWIDYILTMYDEQIYFLNSQLDKYDDVLRDIDKKRR